MRLRQSIGLLGASVAVMLLTVAIPVSAQSSSNNYKVEETFFGSGGELDAASNNYKAKQSAGKLTVGNAASNNYQFYGGFNTTDQPMLEFAVSGGTYDLGILGATVTGAAAAAFTVRSYLSSGYVVTVRGSAPSTTGAGAHTLTSLAAPTGSSPGAEQFGINLVANTNPVIGSNPTQVPDNTYSFGNIAAGYDTANLFKFVDGDTVAFSNKSSGQTSYTLSMIANVARSTASGQYGGTINVEVVPTF